jgi:Tol biopolymer transport system component
MNLDGSGLVNLTNNAASDRAPDWSPDGSRIAFHRTVSETDFDIYVMNADGNIEPAWSPDGSKIAYRAFSGGNYEVFVMNADGSNKTNITNNPAFDTVPAWSPDGTKIAFQSNRAALNNEIYVMNADGSGPTNLTQSPGGENLPAWSPDGRKIAFQSNRDGDEEILVMNADGSSQTQLTFNTSDDGAPEWSPDGRKITFTSDRTGDREVFVMNPDGSGQTNLTNDAALDGGSSWQPLPPRAKAVSLKAKPKVVETGERIRLKAKVTPCDGHEGDVVEFYRKKKRIAKKPSNDNCVAKVKVRVTSTTRFRAVSPNQDLDHLAGTSKRVKVRVLPG